MGKKYNIGCEEFSVPGDTLEDKLKVLESHGMWLELVNRGLNEDQVNHIVGILPSFKTRIVSVQSYLLHDLGLLDDKHQKAAKRHVEETIKAASKVGAKNVITVAAYRTPETNDPFKRCIDTFDHLGRVGAEFGITISVEALSKDKTTFLAGVPEIYDMVQFVNSDNVRLMADTMHIHSNGEDTADVIGEYASEITELHLRDTNSLPPGKGEIDFDSVMDVICKKFNRLLCLEYKPGNDPYKDFEDAYNFISAAR